jgi:hypothetical protein
MLSSVVGLQLQWNKYAHRPEEIQTGLHVGCAQFVTLVKTNRPFCRTSLDGLISKLVSCASGLGAWRYQFETWKMHSASSRPCPSFLPHPQLVRSMLTSCEQRDLSSHLCLGIAKANHCGWSALKNLVWSTAARHVTLGSRHPTYASKAGTVRPVEWIQG